MEGDANEFSGGGNGMSAFPSAVHFDVPVVDGDAMGRAYPTMYHGKSLKHLHKIVLTKTPSNLPSYIQRIWPLSHTLRSLRCPRKHQRSHGKQYNHPFNSLY
jgi:hypothetical protein